MDVEPYRFFPEEWHFAEPPVPYKPEFILQRPQQKGMRLRGRPRLRRIVFARDNFTCQECLRQFKPSTFKRGKYSGGSIPGLTLGHVIPAAFGGNKSPHNLRAQCHNCNNKMGDEVWWHEIFRYVDDVQELIGEYEHFSIEEAYGIEGFDKPVYYECTRSCIQDETML